MTILTYWRAYIGPIYLPAGTPGAYNWQWLVAGAADNFEAAASTLASSLSDGATSLTVADGSLFAVQGGVWVGPNGAGQGWEHVRYTGVSTNTLTGLTRETSGDREHNGAHSSGAVVRQWWPLTGNDGTLRLSEEMDDALCAVSWTAELRGVNAPRAALRSKHLCVVQMRQGASGSFTNWLVGWLESPQARDDVRRRGEWSVRLVSSAWHLQRFMARGVRVGDLDLAKHSTGASSSLALKEADQERWTNDFTAASPDFSASSVADRDRGTLWINEKFVGTPESIPTPQTSPRITQAYLNPPAGSRGGRRWIELTVTEDNNDVQNMSLQIAVAPEGTDNAHWLFNGPGEADQGDRIILCEDQAVFEEEHPASEHVYIKASPYYFSFIQAAGGEIGLRRDPFDAWGDTLRWGTFSANLQDVGGGSDPPEWDGAPVPAPGPGQTLRRLWTPGGTPVNPGDWWTVGYVQTAGYPILTSPDPWLMVSLPPLGLTIRDSITAGSPGVGATLWLTDGADLSAAGLDASGTLLVGAERISYSARTASGVVVSGRGAGGTPAAAHEAGDPVRLIDPATGLAVDCHRYKSIGWRRYGGTIYPKSFRVRVSALDDPRSPDDPEFQNDWTVVQEPTAHNTASWNFSFSPTKRIRHISIQFEEMTADPARPRINEIVALADGATFETALTLAGGATAAAVAAQVAQNAGIPAAAWTSVAGTTGITGVTTAAATAWEVIRDLGDFARMRVVVERDSKLTARPDPFWGAGSFTPSQTWTRTNAAAVEQVMAAALAVRQVEITWRTPDDAGGGVARFPDPAWSDGEILRVADAVYPDSTAAVSAATRLFYLRRFPWTLLVECADAWPEIRPGEIHAVQWQMDASQPLATRLGLVTGVETVIEGQRMSTVLTFVEIDRQSGA